MHQDVPGHALAQGQQFGEIGGRNTFKVPPIPGVVRDAQRAAQEQRIEELLAELAVTQPELAFPIRADREVIDEDRRRPVKLHIIGRGVRQSEAMFEQEKLEIEVEESRVSQQRK